MVYVNVWGTITIAGKPQFYASNCMSICHGKRTFGQKDRITGRRRLYIRGWLEFGDPPMSIKRIIQKQYTF